MATRLDCVGTRHEAVLLVMICLLTVPDTGDGRRKKEKIKEIKNKRNKNFGSAYGAYGLYLFTGLDGVA
jgi:hypothetical protein